MQNGNTMISTQTEYGVDISGFACVLLSKHLESALFYYYRFSETQSIYDWYDTILANANIQSLYSIINQVLTDSKIPHDNIISVRIERFFEQLANFLINYEAIIARFDMDGDDEYNNDVNILIKCSNMNNNHSFETSSSYIDNCPILSSKQENMESKANFVMDANNYNQLFIELYDELNELKNNYFLSMSVLVTDVVAMVDRFRLYGKGYSSDNSGDGPNKGNKGSKKIVQKQTKNEIKQVARSAIKEQLGIILGKTGAKIAYKSGAKIAKNVRRKVKTHGPPGRVLSLNVNNPRSEYKNGKLKLSALTSKYLMSFLKPFSVAAKNAHIPRPSSVPSQKCTGFLRGIGFIGLQGVGYVMYSPCIAKDRPAVYTTSSAYNHTILGLVSNDITTTQLQTSYPGSANSPSSVCMTNLPYTAAQLTDTSIGNTIAGRLVSGTIKMSYTGTVFNASGLMYGYTDINDLNIAGSTHNNATAPTGGYSVNQLSAYDVTEIKTANRRGMEIVCLPNENAYNDYPPFNASVVRKFYPYSQGQSTIVASTDVGLPITCIMITGIPGESFYYECIQHVEYTGSAVPQALLTTSMADNVGFECVQNVLINAQRRCAGDARKNLMTCVKEELRKERVEMTSEFLIPDN